MKLNSLLHQLLLLGTVAAMVYTPTVCAQELHIYGSVIETKFSGKGGGSDTLAAPSGMDASIASIVARERGDDPCHLEVTFHDVNSNAPVHTARFTECANSGNKRDGKKSSEKRIAGSPTLYADFWAVGARVCHNKAGDKVKGLALIFRRKSCVLGEPDFTVIPSSTSHGKSGGHEFTLHSDAKPKTYTCNDPQAESTKWFERTNCTGGFGLPDSDWKREVRCPDGRVAVGLVLSTRDGGGDRTMIDGVAVQCQRVDEVPTGGAWAVRPE